MRIKLKFDNELVIVLLCSIAVSGFLVLRGLGLYPTVFADEYIYSRLSRLLPLSDAAIPGYLYLRVFKLTDFCGDGFLACAKLGNSFLFSLAIPFIFLIARRFSGFWTSIIVSFSAALGPISTYTAYFMPESFYFLGFWFLCWCLLKPNFGLKNRDFFSVGVFFGITSLIKPHSIFFAPALICFILFCNFQIGSLFSLRAVSTVFSFLSGAVLAKFFGGYLAAGSAGLTLFGPLYGSVASSGLSDSQKYLNIAQLAVVSAQGHLLSLVLLYGLPLVITCWVGLASLFPKLFKSTSIDSTHSEYHRLVFLTIMVILNLLCVVAVFTASIANSGPYESPYRLHFRYYNFAIPLLYIVVAGSIVRGSIFNNRVFRYFVCGCVIILAIYALRTELRPYIPSFVDSPEIRGVHTNSSAFRNIGWLLILGLLIWAISENAGSKFFVFVALPALVMVSSYFVYKEQRQRLYPDSYDFAGIFAKQNLKSEELGKTLVLGAAPAGLFRTLFYLDSVDASFEVVSGNTVIDLSRLPPQKDWFLVVGDYTITPGGIEKFKMNGFQLIRRAHLK